MDGAEEIKKRLNPKREAGKEWYLSLLDEEIQQKEEEEHLSVLLSALRAFYLLRYKKASLKAEKERAALLAENASENFREILALDQKILSLKEKIDSFQCFFQEPYFARMDVLDDKEGYNAYYIGKRGDVNLEIVDWRAPLAVRYYQKSRIKFEINEYRYQTVLRRALNVKNGKLLSFQNEYLSVKDHLSKEEIAGRDEEILFDPYLKSILKERKHDFAVSDIITTIQEQQFEIINRPERESFVLQGCAGSGKTMIMLHRLSYLLYNNESLSPRDVLVITPSESFNAFIDELTKVLELQKVKTTTLLNYYFKVLKNEGIDLKEKLTGAIEKGEYLSFLYSSAFPERLSKDLKKLFEGLEGLFGAKECQQIAEQVFLDCRKKQELYSLIKNASARIRRCVLGEMKENEGGFYFTKPFRALMNAFKEIEDFLSYSLYEPPRSPFYFFRQLSLFFKSAKEIDLSAERVFSGAQEDLVLLKESVDKEISDLKRYRRKGQEGEILTYADRIERRLELKREIDSIAETIERMKEGLPLFQEFFSAVKDSCAEAGKCKDDLDLLRWLYKRTLKQYKAKYGMKGVYPSDGYALCALLAAAGKRLTPRYGLVFIDEGQDISLGEYELLRTIHSDAAFNVFGDLRQNITPNRGVKEWDDRFGKRYYLSRNYRNTNEIVEFSSLEADVEMSPVGLCGEPVALISLKELNSFFKDKTGLKAVVSKEEYLPLFPKRGYSLLSKSGKLSKSKINVLSVLECKGLEFSAVAVYSKGMTKNEKYIAYTRALSSLAVVRD